MQKYIYHTRVYSLIEIFTILDFKRKGLTESQRKILMEQFQAKKYLTTQENRKLALLLNLKEGRVARWYSYKRHELAAKGMLGE